MITVQCRTSYIHIFHQMASTKTVTDKQYDLHCLYDVDVDCLIYCDSDIDGEGLQEQ